MKYINEKKIEALLLEAKRSPKKEIEAILKKSRFLKRLSLKEAAALLAVCDPLLIEKIFETAATVKNAIYGSRIVLFAPLYISNLCANRCLYCAFRADNTSIQRRFLTSEDIRHEVRWLLERGHKRILLVACLT